MTKPAEIEGLIALAEETFGSVDVLVNNAGDPVRLADRGFPAGEVGADHRAQPVLGLPHHAGRDPGHEARGWGRIINTASAHSLVASPFKSAYVAAKHGLVGLTKTAALELATHGITVNCISPGYVWTPLVESQIPDTMKARGMTEGAGHQRGAAEGAAHEGSSSPSTRSRPWRCSWLRCGEPDHRRQHGDGWRLDGAVARSAWPPRSVPPRRRSSGTAGARVQRRPCSSRARP